MNKKSIITIIVVAVLVGGIGFYGGMKYGNSQATAASASARARFAGGAGGMGGFAGRNGGGVSAGQIISQDATSITIQLRNGGSQIVLLSKNTPVMKSVSGSPSDLAVGKQVTIVGTSNSDGSITAQSIQLRPDMSASTATTPANN